MRKTLLAAIIAATALVPPAAMAQDRGRGSNRERVQNNESGGSAPIRDSNWGGGNRSGGEARPQRSWDGGNRSGGEARPQRSSGGDGGQARSWRQPATPQTQPAQPQTQPRQWRGNNDGNRGNWRGSNGAAGGQWRDRTPNAQPQATPQQRRDWQDRRGDNRDWNDRNRGDNRGGWNDRNRGDNRGGWNNNNRNDNRWNNNRGWNDNRGWNGNNDRGRWNNSWRSNNRYDWRGFRNGNRNHFRLPRYYAPSNWSYGYRRFGIGFTLNSLLFSSNYWINDPYDYRLPEAYGQYRWVRYYNDALLVDIYTGEVVDTVYDIFW